MTDFDESKDSWIDSLIGQVADDFLHRNEQGEDVNVEEYAERYPQIAIVIRQLFPALQLMQQKAVEPVGITDLTTAYTHKKSSYDWPKQIGRFQILEEIARGGMGAVLRAHDPDLDRPLALKVVLHPTETSPEHERRFLEETLITGQLQHPGIPPVHEQGTLDDGQPFFVMKLIEGATLAELLHTHRTNHKQEHSQSRFIAIFEQICQTIAYAHSQGVIHRDLKPSNIMVGAFGEVQVMDWGLAKRLGKDEPAYNSKSTHPDEASNLTQMGTALGTPAFMAPEQARGEISDQDSRTDVFGLGAILCVILTGEPVYRSRKPLELFQMAQEGGLGDAYARLDESGADHTLINLCKQCLASNRDDRPNNASELADTVASYQESVQEKLRQAELEQAEAQGKAAEERRRRQWTILAAIALVLLVIAVAGGMIIYQREQLQQQSELNQRQALREQQIKDGLQRANELRGELFHLLQKEGGVFKLLSAPDVWQSKLTLIRNFLRQVEETKQASERPFTPELLQQINQVSATLQRDEKDKKIALEFENLHLVRSTLVDGKLNNPFALDKYPKLFNKAGLELRDRSVSEIAETIKQSPIHEQLVAAIDDWAMVISTEEKRVPREQLELARLSDPDVLRDRIRSPQTWGNESKALDLVREITEDPKLFQQLSPRTLILVGNLLKNWNQEADWLRRGQNLYPSDFWLNFELGVALWKTHPQEAIGFYRAALAVRPDSGFVYNGLGAVFKEQGDLTSSIAYHRKAISLSPTFASGHYNLAIALKANKNLTEAIKHYRKAIEFDPDFASAYLNLGVALYEQNDLPGAIEHFKKSVALRKNKAEGYDNLGLALYYQKDIAGAIENYEKALKLNEKLPTIHFNLGNAFLAQREVDKAIASFKRAIELNPKYAEAHSNLATLLYTKRDLKGAIEHFDKAVAANPEYVEGWTNRGVVLAAGRDFDGAIKSYQKALSINPNYVSALNNLGNAWRAKKEFQRARETYNKALKIDSKNAQTHNNLGNALKELKDLQGAIQHYKIAIRLAPNMAATYHNLGIALVLSGKPTEAIPYHQKATLLNPRDLRFVVFLAVALKESEQFAEAINVFEKVLRVLPVQHPERPRIMKWRQECLDQLKKENPQD